MNDINRISGFRRLHAVGQPPSGSSANIQQSQAPKKEQDMVEISPSALFMSKIAMLPEIRGDKVAQIKSELTAGSYDLEAKLSAAIDKFLEDYIWE